MQQFRSEREYQELEAIIKSSPDAIGSVDKNGLVVCWNPAAEELYGYSYEEMNGKSAFDLYADQEQLSQMLGRLRKDGHVKRWEITMLKKDGSQIPFEISINLLKDEDGQVTGSVCVARDISDIKLAMAALQQSKHSYEKIADNMLDMVGMLDENGTYQFISPSCKSALGYETDELLGTSAFDLIHPDDRDGVVLDFHNAVATGNSDTMQYRYLHRDGHYLWLETVGNPIVDKQGKTLHVVLGTRDISDRIAVQEALEAANQKLNDIFDFLPDPTLVINTNHEVIAWNKAMATMTGIQKKDILNKGGYVYAIPFYGERRPILVDLVIENDPDIGNKYQIIRKEDQALVTEMYLAHTGQWFWGKAAPIFDAHGTIIGAIETIRDITDCKRDEANRMVVGKLESLGVLAGGLAHDFNNLLAIILGNIQLAMLETDIGRMKQRLSANEQVYERARGLTSQLLTFSKGGSPKVQVVDVACQLREDVRFALTGSPVGASFHIEAGLWLAAVDPGQLQQAIQNLMINAIEAMPKGGLIEVQARNCHAALHPRKAIRITIRDEGGGMTPEVMARIFDPYFTTKSAGNGLGLSITRSIIERNDGKISVDSKVGQGTTFTIDLPAYEMAKQVNAGHLKRKIPAKPSKKRHRILVMDDEKLIRDVVQGMLSALGYESEAVADGAAAIARYRQAMAEQQPFSAVILDLTIPGGMGGKEAVMAIREIDPSVKAFVSSGYADSSVSSRCEEYGFDGAITKPYTIEKLGTTIRQILS